MGASGPSVLFRQEGGKGTGWYKLRRFPPSCSHPSDEKEFSFPRNISAGSLGSLLGHHHSANHVAEGCHEPTVTDPLIGGHAGEHETRVDIEKEVRLGWGREPGGPFPRSLWGTLALGVRRLWDGRDPSSLCTWMGQGRSNSGPAAERVGDCVRACRSGGGDLQRD